MSPVNLLIVLLADEPKKPNFSHSNWLDAYKTVGRFLQMGEVELNMPV